MNLFSLKNKTILITGASSGIGASCAELCANNGANTILLGRNKDKLERICDKLIGKNHSFYALDLINLNELESFLNSEIVKNTAINGIIHAAGVSLTLPFNYSTPEKLDDVFNINVKVSFELTRRIFKFQKKHLESIVFITSVMANVGERAKTIYSMSKGAIAAGAKSLALELASKQIRVNTISPGVVNTPLTANATYRQSNEALDNIVIKHPLGRLGEPEDVAAACVFLLSNASSWITGTDIKVDGGYTAQ